MIHRPLAAAIASGLVSTLLYPLDTLQATRQYNNKFPEKIYAGLKIDLLNTCITTGSYFGMYETMLQTYPPAFSSAVAVATSGVINTPLSNYKRQIQKSKNKLGLKKIPTIRQLRNSYLLSISKKMPKDVLKYSMYEPLLKCLSNDLNIAISGAIAAAIASAFSTFLTMPLETMRIRSSLGLPWTPNEIMKEKGFKGLWTGTNIYLTSNIIGNMIGHYILELLSPRQS
jgi:hypothetical protein